jgi:phosphoglucosamine mutase
MGTLFGTDGIRGVAGTELTPGIAAEVGRSAAVVHAKSVGAHPRFLIGRDTRLSGPMLEAALVAGITSGGGDVEVLGVMPTPAVASLVVKRGAHAGVVVSASHNPFADNVIKLFNCDGFKLSDDEEAEIETHVNGHDLPSHTGEAIGRVSYAHHAAVSEYVDALVKRIPVDLGGMRIAVDCAHGAMYEAAGLGLQQTGAAIDVLNAAPDGVNINDGCGSTHIGALQEHVRGGAYDLGLAFDGDGDRVLAVDRHGAFVDGDFVIAILAAHLKNKGQLRQDTVVTTVMTNLGFHRAMKREGITVRTTAVGDRYVLADMLAGDYLLGGEQSGHVINLDVSTTGDGLATALLLLQALAESGQTLDEAARIMTRLPQKLVNVRVQDKDAVAGATAVWSAIEKEEKRLGDQGRILVRPSGTEPLVRVMCEADTAEACDGICDRIVGVIEEELG